MAQDAANEAIKTVARHLLRLLWPVRAGCFACRRVPSIDAIAEELTAAQTGERSLKMREVCQAIVSHRSHRCIV